MENDGPRAPLAVTATTCDCDGCRPGCELFMSGNPPHGWLRLARDNLSTREDDYLWCCSACHTLVYDEGDTTGWRYLKMHWCPVKGATNQ